MVAAGVHVVGALAAAGMLAAQGTKDAGKQQGRARALLAYGALASPRRPAAGAEDGALGGEAGQDSDAALALEAEQLEHLRYVYALHSELDDLNIDVAERRAALARLENDHHDAVCLTVVNPLEEAYPPIPAHPDVIEARTDVTIDEVVEVLDRNSTFTLVFKREAELRKTIRRREIEMREAFELAGKDLARARNRLWDASSKGYKVKESVDKAKRELSKRRLVFKKKLAEFRAEYRRIVARNEAEEAARRAKIKRLKTKSKKQLDKRGSIAHEIAQELVPGLKGGATDSDELVMGRLGVSDKNLAALRQHKINSPDELYRRFIEARETMLDRETGAGLAQEKEHSERTLQELEAENAASLLELRELRSTGGINISAGRAEVLELSDSIDKRNADIRSLRAYEERYESQGLAIAEGVRSVVRRVALLDSSASQVPQGGSSTGPPAEEKPVDEGAAEKDEGAALRGTSRAGVGDDAARPPPSARSPRLAPRIRLLDEAERAMANLTRAIGMLASVVGPELLAETSIHDDDPEVLAEETASHMVADDELGPASTAPVPPSTSRPAAAGHARRRLYSQVSIRANIKHVQGRQHNNRVLRFGDSKLTEIEYWDAERAKEEMDPIEEDEDGDEDEPGLITRETVKD